MADQRDDIGFELLPADALDDISPEEELNAAAASALADDSGPAPGDDEDRAAAAPEPFGASWAFDWDAGRFTRRGSAPARVTGEAALIEVCMMCLNTARGAHVVFSEDFGIDEPVGLLGAAGEAAREAADDYKAAAIEALSSCHDRIADVTMDVAYDPVEGLYWVTDLTVTTDEEQSVSLPDLLVARS